MSEVDRLKARWLAANVAAVRAFVEDAGGEAARRAPIKEGTLRGSMEADVDVVTLGTGGYVVEGEIRFNEVYAARQHEEDEWQHPLGGQADYLGSVMRERAPRLEVALAAANRRVF